METNAANKSTRADAEQAAAAWLLKRSDPNWSVADQVEFDRWLNASPGHRVSFIRLESIWADTDRLKSVSAGFPQGQIPPRGAIEQSPFFTIKRAEDSVTSLNSPLPRAGEGRGTRARVYAIAASLLVAVAAGLLVYSLGFSGGGKNYGTSVGGLSTIPTQDGSVITLNTNSEIEVQFTERERCIKLKRGEAFFEVAKDPARPFTVYANRQRVVAVGTKFSVRLDSQDIQVAVTEGKVRLLLASARSPSLLHAGTVAEVRKQTVNLHPQSIADIEQALSWRTGYIVLNGTPLTQAIAEFNRYNTRQLSVEDSSIAAMKVEGNFRSNNIDGFVRLLEQGFHVKATEEDGRIVLSQENSVSH